MKKLTEICLWKPAYDKSNGEIERYVGEHYRCRDCLGDEKLCPTYIESLDTRDLKQDEITGEWIG